MTSIEYNGVKIEIPTNWGDITVNDYEEAQILPSESVRDKVAIVARLCRVPDALLLEWPTQAFETIVECVTFVWGNFEAKPCPSVTVGGVKYVVSIDQVLTLGEWIDADEAQKNGEHIFSRLLAVVCRPAGEAYDSDRNEDRAAMFAALPADQIQSVVSFFLHYEKQLNTTTEAYLKLEGAISQLPPSIELLRRAGGGTRLSRILRAIRYWILTKSLRCQLAKCSPSYPLKERGRAQKWRNERMNAK